MDELLFAGFLLGAGAYTVYFFICWYAEEFRYRREQDDWYR